MNVEDTLVAPAIDLVLPEVAVAIEEMAKGNIDAMVVQNPFDMGFQSVRLLKAMLTDDKAMIGEMFPR